MFVVFSLCGIIGCMFSIEESDFIRALSADYKAIRKAQLSLNKAPIVAEVSREEDERRKLGSTDYKKFEGLEKSIDQQEAFEKWKDDQESAAKWCKIDHVHGPNCKTPITGCSHDHSDERKLFEKSFEDKLKAIRLFRVEGNAAFSAKDFPKAVNGYRNALLYLDYSFGDTDLDEETLDEERYKCHINLAATWLELEEYIKAVEDCRRALDLKKDSIKAFFRRGLANTKLGNFDQAMQDLNEAKKLNKCHETNISILSALKDLDKQLAEYNRRSKDIAVASLDLE